MKDPHFIEGPALILFSGGRTSGYMLRHILDAHNGELPDDVHVVFSDTGRERPETLDFVHECSKRWGVKVNWLKREGQFQGLIDDHLKESVPNVFRRLCTHYLKVELHEKFAKEKGFDFYSTVLGLRADEPARVAKMRDKEDKNTDFVLPLADAGANEIDILDFWANNDFDLNLKPGEGNCDLCFLKGKRNLIQLIMDRPELADWWIKNEERSIQKYGIGFFGSQKNANATTYRKLATIAENMNRQTDLGFDVDVRHVAKGGRAPVRKKNTDDQLSILFPDDDSKPCLCGD
jgi:3'-phosphoadenosine 5'-phosphosulfate sulfotransferase (PAPS reductase)/FAD synthetase